jgi:hypothetical protein
VGTADDPGVSFTYYEFPSSLQGAQFVQGMLINPDGMDARYKSYELALMKRLSNHWLMLASYSSTTRDVPVQADSGAPPSANPNAFINTADRNREWVGKISGAYYFPADVVFSINYQNLSGSPYARNVLFTGGVTIPSDRGALGRATTPARRFRVCQDDDSRPLDRFLFVRAVERSGKS